MLLIFLITIGLFVYLKSNKSRIIAKVGDYTITQSDIDYRDKIQRFNYPQDPNTYGKEQLTHSYTIAQILKNNGMEITERTLRVEDMRIEQNTKDRAALNKIKAVFGQDQESYYKVFILPTYAERTISGDFFNKNPKFQSQSLARVQSFLAEFKSTNQKFSKFAKNKNTKVQQFELSLEKGMQWIQAEKKEKGNKDSTKQTGSSKAPVAVQKQVQDYIDGQSLESARFWIENVMPKLHPGEIWNEPVDHGADWMIVNYVKPLGQKKYLMEAVFFMKDSFQQWLETEKAKVNVL